MPGVRKTVKPKTQLFYGICQTGVVRNNVKRVDARLKDRASLIFLSQYIFLILWRCILCRNLTIFFAAITILLIFVLPEENRPIWSFGDGCTKIISRNIIPSAFNDLCLSGKLWTCLADLNEQAQNRLELIIEQMKATEGITEVMKQHDQMAWIRAMNSICNRAEKIIIREMIYEENVV